MNSSMCGDAAPSIRRLASALVRWCSRGPGFGGTVTCGLWVSHPWDTAKPRAARREVLKLGFRSRGVKANDGSGRGARSLRAAVAPNIITEPFFGSNAADSRLISGRESALAMAYLRGVRGAAVELGLAAGAPPPPPDTVTVAFPRQTYDELMAALGAAGNSTK